MGAETLTIERIEATPETLAPLLPAFDGNPAGLVALAFQLREGGELYSVRDASGDEIGRYAARLDGVEFEVLAATGDTPGDLARRVMPMVEQSARAAGAVAVRFSTFRPGLMRRMQREGWRGISMTMWKGF